MQWQPATTPEKLSIPFFDESLLKIAADILGRRTVKWNKPSFSGNHDLASPDALGCQRFKSRADGALTPLKTVVNRAVDNVAP